MDGSSGAPRADDVVARAERDGALRDAVSRLEPNLQEAIALHYFQELSFSEVAAVLGVPSGTAKSRIHQALTRLRDTELKRRLRSVREPAPSIW